MPSVLQSPSAKHLRESVAQGFLDFLVPADRRWFTPAEVGEIIGFRETFVVGLIEAGKLAAYRHNGQRVEPGEKVTRKLRCKILRDDLNLYLLGARNVHPADSVARLCGIIDTLPLTAATLVADHAVKHRNKLITR